LLDVNVTYDFGLRWLDQNLFKTSERRVYKKAVQNVEEAIKLGEIGFETFDMVNASSYTAKENRPI